ncbi:oxygenase [Lithospermum erythrorhizon]|uniref:Oxygenase n=1 Tax=Lithospermum erythrorhizon TaxID=34254 RepID=A0AAV3PZ93_LITER
MDSTNMDIALLLMILCFVYLWCRFRNSNGKRCVIPSNWPVVGMIPGLLCNLHRIHEYGVDVLESSGGTFMFKGPWFTNVDMLITCDPTNVHYILSKNFLNFGRGPQFKKMFADLGDGIFNAEGEFWGIQRKTTQAVFHHSGFKNFLVMSTRDKVEKGMIQVLDHVSKLGIDVDLQELIQRFAFDITCVLLLDYDPASLSVEFPDFPFNRAFAEAEEAIFFRHIAGSYLEVPTVASNR